MTVMINGEKQIVPDTVGNIQQLLEYLQLADRIVVVEINRDILQKDRHAVTELKDGDTIELVHFVGGG
ncbi:thiamine biosynthesis protein ThiS [Aneurinibacillus migulanus]|uniref:Sulfur carrier protein n=2 Tax=Aneurinibacillus migulanus TaxID=47500 RepID=A0A0D1VI21_ANEMI|nr:thiamine biosynthesis protein ThiS [Aneurinibacillus migulanus]KIV59079.1 thiamine biosynthesis protein ThiS [Aneurinibacillus migulanus]KON99210.1 thiamine biosynthesis protein ThiS [Aneurinibacillus migulanus]KPD07034.1 thiamine biosynthesis protein ThiS [Aneurinibacillus migulanus]MED0893371.1 sulfur carrier protein ThiS [Aneurinibacillus migulanus]